MYSEFLFTTRVLSMKGAGDMSEPERIHLGSRYSPLCCIEGA